MQSSQETGPELLLPPPSPLSFEIEVAERQLRSVARECNFYRYRIVKERTDLPPETRLRRSLQGASQLQGPSRLGLAFLLAGSRCTGLNSRCSDSHPDRARTWGLIP